MVGLYYYCSQNYEQSKKWYKLAATQGDLRAKAILSGKKKEMRQ